MSDGIHDDALSPGFGRSVFSQLQLVALQLSCFVLKVVRNISWFHVKQ